MSLKPAWKMPATHLLFLHLPPLLLVLVCRLPSLHIWSVTIWPFSLSAFALAVLAHPAYPCPQAANIPLDPLDKSAAFSYLVIAQAPSVARGFDNVYTLLEIFKVRFEKREGSS